MKTRLVSTLPKLGKSHTKLHGMARGIASRLLLRWATPITPFTSLSPSVPGWSHRATFTSLKLPLLSGKALSPTTPAPLLVSRRTDSFCRPSILWSFSPFRREEDLLPSPPPILRDTPYAPSLAHTSLPTHPSTQGTHIPCLQDCMTPMTSPCHRRWSGGRKSHPQFFRWLSPPLNNAIQFHLGYLRRARHFTNKDSTFSLPQISCTIPIRLTGFQPIVHMLSPISLKNIYQC